MDSSPIDSSLLRPSLHDADVNLADKFLYPESEPLASRIVSKAHVEPVNSETTERYLSHHLALTGIQANLFDEAAVTAIQQGSGGFYERLMIWRDRMSRGLGFKTVLKPRKPHA
jgi:hypothetical protein